MPRLLRLGIKATRRLRFPRPIRRQTVRSQLVILAPDGLPLLREGCEESWLPGSLLAGCFFFVPALQPIAVDKWIEFEAAPRVGVLFRQLRAELDKLLLQKLATPTLELEKAEGVLPLSLSYDHRVIDGAAAARFVVLLGALLADVRRWVS